jgi:hypothetical protein
MSPFQGSSNSVPKPRRTRRLAWSACLLFALPAASALLPACASAEYWVRSKFGQEKRDILVARVKDAREDQQEAKQQFQTTFEQFKALTGYQGGELEDKYNKLNSEYQECESKATTVRERITSIEKVSSDLFAEWRKEIGEISDPSLKKQSSESLEETKQRSNALIDTMKKAASSMTPVLTAFKDRVLFLKHNLNAQAIASLSNQVVTIEGDVSALIGSMETSIREADEFIGKMGSQ